MISFEKKERVYLESCGRDLGIAYRLVDVYLDWVRHLNLLSSVDVLLLIKLLFFFFFLL